MGANEAGAEGVENFDDEEDWESEDDEMDAEEDLDATAAEDGPFNPDEALYPEEEIIAALKKYSKESMQIAASAIQAIQQAGVAYLEGLFDDSARCASQRNAPEAPTAALQPRDVQLARRIRGERA